MLMSPMVARVGEAGSALGVGAGRTGAVVGEGDGLEAAVRDAGGRLGVCAATTINKKTATDAAAMILNEFIKRVLLIAHSYDIPAPANGSR
jgi:hypothetical protein